MSNPSQSVSHSQQKFTLRNNIWNAGFSKISLARNPEDSDTYKVLWSARHGSTPLQFKPAWPTVSDRTARATQRFILRTSKPNQTQKNFIDTYLMIFTICSWQCSCLNLLSAGITGLCPHLDLHLLFSIN
jgi:hypothetical protein|uniref:Uncharacterized protein n=1 Tax=Mus musculus TaxID=10090 RepID=Q8BPV1_MOUSE|nr:unnamed protein product [Mus musculus]